MIINQIKQQCLRCKGTGIDKNKMKTDEAGRVILAPPYQKGEGDKPQFENCKECNGEGMTLQPLPTEILRDGEKIKLTPDEAKARYATL